VFGYPAQSPTDVRLPDDMIETRKFLRNGSFLVFRRLRQNVRLFNAETERMAAELSRFPEFARLSVETLRAKLVGRWRDGAPLTRFPDDPPPGPFDLDTYKHFNFISELPGVTLADGKSVPAAPADPFGQRCPFYAHIRKVNPRDASTDQGPAAATQKIRLLRRGIPYGEPYDPADPDDDDRGLLFLCYQTSIRNQFERLSNRWIDSAINPEGDKGHDMIVGQNGVPSRERYFVADAAGAPSHRVATMRDWIAATGGGYFFCPSRSCLRAMAAGG
jgi:Dyp-type peroxidase family